MIRHSSLPKLAVSPCYESNPVAGDAAARGTKLDQAFRDAFNGILDPIDAPEEDDRKAVLWAIAEAKRIANPARIETNEGRLRVITPGIDHIGTEDGRVAERCLSFDLKTGQIRNYREQFAAYALGNMEAYFADEWTTVALFCDQQEAVRYTFTRQEAEQIVKDVLKGVADRNPDEYTPSEYCGWCKHKDTCPTRTGPVDEAVRQVELVSASIDMPASVSLDIGKMREGILANPETMAKFITAFKLLEKEIAEPVIEAARERLKDREGSIPGWKIQYQSGREYFGPDAVAKLYDSMGRDAFISLACGSMSGKAYREACAQLNIEVNETLAQVGKPIEKLVAAKPTRKKK